MHPPADDERTASERNWRRRRVLAAGSAVGATLLAGCSSGTDAGAPDGETSSGDSDETGDTTTSTGGFRLLISDQPVAIDEFDELNVSFDRARIFRGGGDGTATPTPTEIETGTANATATGTPTTTDADADDGESRGFTTVDLGGATVDLTQVVGDKAVGVFDGELEEGRYTKIELYAAGVEGIVDGESVTVKIPSGKLQIVKPFDVVAGETLQFVFDINVAEKGRTGEYNLLPVISESGVAGQDVEVTEVGTRGPNAGGGAGGSGDDDGATPEPTETDDDDGEGGRDGRGDGGERGNTTDS